MVRNFVMVNNILTWRITIADMFLSNLTQKYCLKGDSLKTAKYVSDLVNLDDSRNSFQNNQCNKNCYN